MMSKVKKDEPTDNVDTTPETDTPASGALFTVPNEYLHPEGFYDAIDFRFLRSMASVTVSAASNYYIQTHSELQTTEDTQMDTGDGPSTVVLSGGLTLEDLRAAMQHFTHERDWDKFHSPRNLLCALVRNHRTLQRHPFLSR